MKQLAQALRAHADTIEHTHTAMLIRVLARILEGNTVYKSFGAPGDWGYGRPIGKGVLAMLTAGYGDAHLTSTPALQWHYCDDGLPDDDVQVCVSVRDPDGECYFFLGHHSGDKWVCEDEMETPFLGEVYAWAEVPEAAPRKKGGAS